MYVDLKFADESWAVTTIEAMAGFAEENRAELGRCQSEGRFPAELYAAMGANGWVGPFTPDRGGGQRQGSG